MIILGIDPGTAVTGWGIIREDSAGRCAVIDQGAVVTAAKTPLARRLASIFDAVDALIKEHRPDVMAVEQLFFIHNTRSRVGVGQSRGVILLAAEKNGIPVAEYPPTGIKLAVCGYGAAGKGQVAAMVKNLLGLKDIPKPDDVADALAAAICHAHSYRVREIGGVR